MKEIEKVVEASLLLDPRFRHLTVIGIHAPAWPGYPDRSKIPENWKPIEQNKDDSND